MDRRLVSILLVIAALAASQPPSAGAQSASVVVDGRMVDFDQPPAIIDGRLLIPLRGVFERLGATVEWQPSPGLVVARRGATVIVLQPGNRTARVDNRTIPLDVPAVIATVARSSRCALSERRSVPRSSGSRRAGSCTSPHRDRPVRRPRLRRPTCLRSRRHQCRRWSAPLGSRAAGAGIGGRYRHARRALRHLAAAPRALPGCGVRHSRSGGCRDLSHRSRNGPGRRGVSGTVRRGDFVRVLVDAQGRAISIRASYRHLVGRLERLTNRRLVLAEGQILTLAAEVLLTL